MIEPLGNVNPRCVFRGNNAESSTAVQRIRTVLNTNAFFISHLKTHTAKTGPSSFLSLSAGMLKDTSLILYVLLQHTLFPRSAASEGDY